MPGLLPSATTEESVAFTNAVLLFAVIKPVLFTVTVWALPPAPPLPPIDKLAAAKLRLPAPLNPPLPPPPPMDCARMAALPPP